MVRLLLFGLMALLVSGCSEQDIFDKFASPEEQAKARSYLDQIHAHDFAAITRDIDPSLNNSSFQDMLQKMAALPPAGEPTSVKVVGAQSFDGPGERKVNVTFEYEFAGKWFIENIATQEKNNTKTVIGLHIIPLPKSLEEQNRFTLLGKNPLQYTFLIVAASAVIVTLYALVTCIRTKPLRRKWLWILFVLFGFGSVGINWTTGEVGYQILHLKLFSASAVSQLYGPWIISFSVPLGAIVFLLRNKLNRRTEAP